MNRLTMATVLLVLAFGIQGAAAQATAQEPYPKKQAPASSKVSQMDVTFAKEAAVGGLAEVELGKLASENAASADVKEFGQRMVTDHGKANEELKTLAEKLNITLPAELDAKYKNMQGKLSKLKGAEFDRAYMREMVSDHQQDVAKFRKASKTAKDSELKDWAAKTLPTLEEHLKQAKEISSKLGGTMTKKK